MAGVRRCKRTRARRPVPSPVDHRPKVGAGVARGQVPGRFPIVRTAASAETDPCMMRRQASTLGTRRMVRLARRWVEGVRAAALVRRPDAAPRLVTLAPDMLLVLRRTDLLLLVASARWLLGVRAPGSVLELDAVDIELEAGCGLARPLRIATKTKPWSLPRRGCGRGQRAALERIEGHSGAS